MSKTSLKSLKAVETTQDANASMSQSFRLVPKKTPATHSFSKHKYKRPSIPIKIKRAVFQKAGHMCEHINSKTQAKCSSRYQLQIDHVKPLAKGGTDEIANLRVLCGVHNRYEALKWGLSRPL